MPAKKLISSWHARYLIFFGLAVIVIAVFFILLAPYSQLHASINSINFKYRFTLVYVYIARCTRSRFFPSNYSIFLLLLTTIVIYPRKSLIEQHLVDDHFYLSSKTF